MTRAREPKPRTSARSVARTRWRRWLRRAVLTSVIAGLGATAIVVIAWFVSPFPIQLLSEWPTSPRVTDRHGEVLIATVGRDDQWRQPVPLSEMGEWLPVATIAVEDERFRAHPGVDPLAITRAVGQNLAHRRVVSGASTLTMQLCRMMYDRRRPDRPRSLINKAVEAFRALQLETRATKDEILEHYLNVAPYGGNLRGVEAAARRYFGKAARDLALSEAALLAGLPQSPERLRPDRHPDRALARRNHVLRRLLDTGQIDVDRFEHARAMPLALVDLRSATDRDPARSEGASLAPHAAWYALSQRPHGGAITLDLELQRSLLARVPEWRAGLPETADLAIVAIDVATGDVLAWIGSAEPRDPRDGQVDGVMARRSPGSCLKPFLYAFAFDRGRLGPDTLVPDRPIERGAWRPENFDGEYSGSVSVEEALRRSLNVPAILILEHLGLESFVRLLGQLAFDLPADTARERGLALITGAVELRLVDLTNAYATLARGGAHRPWTLWAPESRQVRAESDRRVFAETTARAVNDVLSSHARLERAGQGLTRDAVPWFMWKTGTSSKKRDAWAIGHNGVIALGVWVGDFSGACHSAFVGAEAAQPILIDVFTSLPLQPAPPSAPAIIANRPLDLRTNTRGLRILEPRPTEVFRVDPALGRATVRLRASTAEPPFWFVDDRAVAGSTLSLRPGCYQLRCVTADGRSIQERIVVE